MIKTLNKIICLFLGHNKTVGLIETKEYITKHKCSRCNCALFTFGWTWKIKDYPPPNSTKEDIVRWEKFCETNWQEIRDSVNAV